MELSFEQKAKIGFQYILECMHPCSPYGQEQVRRITPYAPEKSAELEEELDNLQRLTEHLAEYKMEIRTMQRIFMQMKSIRPALKKAAEMPLGDIELFELKNFLLCTGNAKKQQVFLSAKLGLAHMDFRDTEGALAILDPDGRRIPTFSVYDSYSAELKAIRERKKALEAKMAKAEGEEYEQLKEARRLAVVEEEAQEQVIRAGLTEKLRPYLSDMEKNADVTARWDLLLEKAALAARGNTVKPEITKDSMELKQAVNPSVEKLLKERGGSFTPIDIMLERGSTVITGANMGGKSVALQTIVLNTVLALCGFYVYAASARIPHFGDIRLISEDMQSVRRGLSSFGAEVMQLEEAVRAADQAFCFVVFDEFSRGTNPHEGEALVRAVVRFFNRGKGMALLVTHYDHVAEYAGAHYQVKGLADMDPERVKAEIAAAGEGKGVSVIASHMNYGLFRVTDQKDCPKEALNICRLLGLDERVMAYITES